VRLHALSASDTIWAPPVSRPPLETISIVIADSHPRVREELRIGLSHEPDFLVIGEAADRDEALRLANSLNPQVMLLDPALSHNSGLDVLRALIGRPLRTRTIVMARPTTNVNAIAAFQHGARGVVTTDTPNELLFKSIRKVHRGELWISRESVGDLVDALVTGAPPPPLSTESRPDISLTAREKEILALLA